MLARLGALSGLGFRVWGLGFRVWGLGSRAMRVGNRARAKAIASEREGEGRGRARVDRQTNDKQIDSYAERGIPHALERRKQ